jgi:hypothetical protein
VTASIDLSIVNKLRKEVPLKRRTDVYPELWEFYCFVRSCLQKVQ